ncbi:MAG: chloride channel protein [Opitutales bacterium]
MPVKINKTSYRFPAWSLRHLPDWMRLRFSDTQRHFTLWVLAGLACGLTAVGYHETIAMIFAWVLDLSERTGGVMAMVILVAAPTLGGLISGIISTKIEPQAAGGGITETKARYYLNFGIFRLREAVWRFIASAIAIGSGISMGPEGPTVHICAAVASKIGQMFGLAKQRVQAMVPVGTGAGLAAAFNTPMAAMFFVFEELLGDISSKSLFGILVAVVISAIVERTLLGEHALFTIGLPAFATSWWMLLSIPLGILCAFVGTLFVRTLLSLRLKAREVKSIPTWVRPAISGLLVGLTGVLVLLLTGHSGVFSIGYSDLSLALNGKMVVPSVILLLLFGKFFAYIVAATSATSGGLFAPVLFFGGMLGAMVGVSGQLMGFGYHNDVVGALALIGMGCFFATVIRCPLTSFMIVFEMTRNYTIMLPLMGGNIIAYMLATRWHPLSLYDSMLIQDKITLKRMPSYQGEQDWHNLPVKAIMTFDVVTVAGALDAVTNLKRIATDGNKHHAYPVLNPDKALLGVVTHAELERQRDAGSICPVSEKMGRHSLVAISSETSIRDVARILVTEDVLQAPVVSPTDRTRMLGIVTLHDIARQQNAISESIGR